MKAATRKSRRGANLAAARAVKAARDSERIAASVQRDTIAPNVAAYIVRHYVAQHGGRVPLDTVQRGAQERTPGAALTLATFERLAQRHTARRRGIESAMREDNAGTRSARLTWPETRDRTPSAWRRTIVAPEGGIARLAWRETLVRHGVKAAAEWCEQRGTAWRYPATTADAIVPARLDVRLATTTADRQALADGVA